MKGLVNQAEKLEFAFRARECLVEYMYMPQATLIITFKETKACLPKFWDFYGKHLVWWFCVRVWGIKKHKNRYAIEWVINLYFSTFRRYISE